MGGVRTILLVTALLRAGCGRNDPASFQRRNADSWTSDLSDPARRAAAHDALAAGGEDALGVLIAILQGDEGVAAMISADLAARLGPRAGRAGVALKEALEKENHNGVAAMARGRIGPDPPPAQGP